MKKFVLLLIPAFLFSGFACATSYECTNQLTTANFVSCYPDGVVSNVTIESANLAGSTLMNVTFTNVTINNSNFTNAQLEVSLNNVVVNNSNFNHALFFIPKFNNVKVESSNMNYATLAGEYKFGSNYEGYISDSSFDGVSFYMASFIYLNIINSSFNNVNMFKNTFSMVQINFYQSGMFIESSQLVNSNFVNSTISNNVKFLNSNLSSSSFSTSFVGTPNEQDSKQPEFNNCNLEYSNFYTGSSLFGYFYSYLLDSNLSGATWIDSYVCPIEKTNVTGPSPLISCRN